MTFYRGMGCEVCNNTGYKGRVGLFELMIITDKLRDMIMENASVDEMRRRGAKRTGWWRCVTPA
jgi:type IV pilus assembly protein PilB